MFRTISYDIDESFISAFFWLPFAMPLASVVQTLDSAIQRINHYPADSLISFPNTYPLGSDLSSG